MNESTLAIVLLVVGLAFIFISFLFSEKYLHKDIDKQEEMSKVASNIQEKQQEEIANFTNKKMVAINEYYTFVIEEIEKKHKELLFLYHMISEKDSDLQKEIQSFGTKIEEIIAEKQKLSLEITSYNTPQKTSRNGTQAVAIDNRNKSVKVFENKSKNLPAPSTKDNSQVTSNNDIILDLYAQGCSVKEIAYKLSLGIGEVKLVIDLFSEVKL